MARAELVINIKTLLDKNLVNKQVNEVKQAISKIKIADIGKEIEPGITRLKQSFSSLSLKDVVKDTRELASLLSNSIKNSTGLQSVFDKVKSSLGGVSNSFKNVNTGLADSTKKTSLLKQAMPHLTSQFIGNAAFQSIAFVKDAINDVAKAGVEYEASLADFSALTGVQGDALVEFDKKAKQLAETFGGNATNQIEIFKGVLSRLGPDIAKSPEALEKMTVAINTLAAASGLSAAESMDALTTAALQMGIDLSNPVTAADEMTKFMNVMAAAAQQGAAEIPAISEAMVVAGVAAKNANLNFEEVNAAIQMLALGGKYGSEAGTGLRNILGLIQKASGPAADALGKMGLNTTQLGTTLTTQGLGNALQMLNEGLNRLGSDTERNAALINIFGVENANAAAILIENADAMGDFQQKITDTSTGFEQAATKMDTFASRMDRFQAKLQNVGLEVFKNLQPALDAAFSVISETILPVLQSILTPLTPIISEIFNELRNIFASIAPIITNLVSAIIPIIEPLLSLINALYQGIMPILDVLVTSLTPVISDIITLIKVVIDAINPLLPVVGLLIANLLQALLIPMTPIIRLLIQVTTLLREPISFVISLFAAMIEPIARGVEYILKMINSFIQIPFDYVAKGLVSIREYFANVIQFVKNLIQSIGGLITKFLQFIGIIDDSKAKEVKFNVKTDDAKNDVADLKNAINTTANTLLDIDLNKKIKPIQAANTVKAIEDILLAFKKLQKQIDYSQKLDELSLERQRLLQNRTKNIYDEVAAYELQKKSITELNTALQQYIDKYKITLDDRGRVVSFAVKLDDKNKEAVTNEIERINLELKKLENTEIELKARILANDKEFSRKLAEFDDKELDFKIKIGVIDEDVKLEIIRNELEKNTAALKQYETEIEQYKTRKNELTIQELQLYEDVRNKYIETRSKQIELNNQIYDAELKQQKKMTEVTLQELDKRDKYIKEQQSKYIEIYKSIAELQKDALQNKYDTQQNFELDKLDKQRDANLINEEVYQKEKLKIQQHYNNLKYVQEQAHLAAIEELQYQSERKALQDKKESLQKEIDVAIAQGNSEMEATLRQQLQQIANQLETEYDVYTRYASKLGNAIKSSFATMFDGNEEDLKRPWRKLFAVTASALKTQLEMLIADLAMKELQKLAFFQGGVGAVLVLPVIIGALRGLLGAALNPLLSSISSFSTGGRVDEPTLAVVGDASLSRAGTDTEWILRDDQISLIMSQVVNKYRLKAEVEFVDNLKMLTMNFTPELFAKHTARALERSIKQDTNNNNESLSKTIALQSVSETIQRITKSENTEQSNVYSKHNYLQNLKYLTKLNEDNKVSELTKFNHHKIDISPLLHVKPAEITINTTNIEKLLLKIIDKIDEKQVSIELDGEKLNKQLTRIRNKIKYT